MEMTTHVPFSSFSLATPTDSAPSHFRDCPPILGEDADVSKSFKGLRDFSRMVADKVQLKGVTTYNEVSVAKRHVILQRSRREKLCFGRSRVSLLAAEQRIDCC